MKKKVSPFRTNELTCDQKTRIFYMIQRKIVDGDEHTDVDLRAELRGGRGTHVLIARRFAANFRRAALVPFHFNVRRSALSVGDARSIKALAIELLEGNMFYRKRTELAGIGRGEAWTHTADLLPYIESRADLRRACEISRTSLIEEVREYERKEDANAVRPIKRGGMRGAPAGFTAAIRRQTKEGRPIDAWFSAYGAGDYAGSNRHDDGNAVFGVAVYLLDDGGDVKSGLHVNINGDDEAVENLNMKRGDMALMHCKEAHSIPFVRRKCMRLILGFHW